MPSGLGRGLGSLIPQKINKEYSDFAFSGAASAVYQISPADIVANPFQPRRTFSEESIAELADSIKEHGLLQPIVVTRQGDKYELIAGERRFRACQLLKLKEISAIVREASEQKKLELALIENIQRENLNPVDTAVAYNQLLAEFNLTQEELAHKVSKPRSSVANSLRLLNLSPTILQALAERKITEAHAKYLLGLDTAQRELMFNKILRQSLSVKDTDTLIKSMGGTKAATVLRDPGDKTREERLKTFFASKAEIKRAKVGGRITIDFGSDEELNEIISKIERF